MADDDNRRAQLKASHTRQAIRSRLASGPVHSYLRDFIYGAIDGAVTTFAIVSGVAGADLSNSIVIILGVANLIGDGFSMAAGNFLGVRAERQQRELLRAMEHQHISDYPEGEREEVREIFRQKGFEDNDLDRAVEIITGNRERWVQTMLTEEHGVPLTGPSAIRAALVTFAAFLLVGAIPLLTFLFDYFGMSMDDPFFWSATLTGVAFFLTGALKCRFVEQSWVSAGLETLAVGGSAAALSYVVGALLGGLAR
ncbi:MAG: VIT1/CCC1 transporter family protein [Acidobacteria bacterium]|nr:VIT1/CCC1 transporter family protein [Acidobacteriota bacterium]